MESSSLYQSSKIVYVHSEKLTKESVKIPNISDRASMVHSLITAYGLLKFVKVVDVVPASDDDLCLFHSRLYVDHLKKISQLDASDAIADDENEDFGIGYDCPFVNELYTLATLIAGSSVVAAKSLCNRSADIAINWMGGWHHAQRDEAEGFCYVNDIVLAAEILRTRYEKVLYIDLDVHHGNGVENAFSISNKVFTVSFHKHEVGFYPGTGSLEDVGLDNGKYYAVNVPLKEGLQDIQFCNLFKRITDAILSNYNPSAVIVQCGADGLTGDKLGGFNLTLTAFSYCTRKILQWKKPTLFVGGGGYNTANVARCWTYLTSIICGQVISNNIPDNEYFSEYGPDFTLHISPSNRKDYNDENYLTSVLNTVLNNINTHVK